MSNVFKNIGIWFRSLFKKQKESELEEQDPTYTWDEIVEVMKIYGIQEAEIIIGKMIYDIKYIDKKTEKTVSIEYPVTWNDEKKEFVHHKDIEHNIRFKNKIITDIHTSVYTSFIGLGPRFYNKPFILERILELNNVS